MKFAFTVSEVEPSGALVSDGEGSGSRALGRRFSIKLAAPPP